MGLSSGGKGAIARIDGLKSAIVLVPEGGLGSCSQGIYSLATRWGGACRAIALGVPETGFLCHGHVGRQAFLVETRFLRWFHERRGHFAWGSRNRVSM